MPIFISYSHKDKGFVDALALQLVRHNVNVWLDRWELHIGDSIIDRVQRAIEGSSALLVILSQASVSSEWCKKEMNSGFLRELEERTVMVMPVVIEDCEIPLFARDKLYADFRQGFDSGIRVVLESVAKFSNPHLARTGGPEWHTDWSLEWGEHNGRASITLTYVEQVDDQPYTCLTMVDIDTNDISHRNYTAIVKRHGQQEGIKYVIQNIRRFIDSTVDIRPILSDEKRYQRNFVISGSKRGEKYFVRVIARRMGEDTGRDILMNTSNLLRSTHDHMDRMTAKSYPERSG